MIEHAVLRLILWTAPPDLAEHLAGDLAEEAAQRSASDGPLQARAWLLQHGLLCALHALRIRCTAMDLTECAAAYALLLALPLTLLLALRNQILTLIPYRVSAEFSREALFGLGVATALSSAWAAWLLGRRPRAWITPPIAMTLAAAAALCATGLTDMEAACLIACAGGGACLGIYRTGGRTR